MLKACGIVAEYNPFHYGHAYQLKQARQQSQADCLIVAMSGNFVQRGEPAILDKWQRARMALTNGADLVVELPFSVSCQPADKFAQGALRILQAFGCHDLAFGTEDAQFDYAALAQKIQPYLQDSQFKVDYRKTYATQWNEFLQQVIHQEIKQPNQLLGLSYALANTALTHPLQLIPIQRQQVAHDGQTTSAHFASAAQIRQWLLAGDLKKAQSYVPDRLTSDLGPFISVEQLWPFLHYRLMTTWPQELTSIYQMSEGLEYRFSEKNQTSTSWSDFLRRVKSKRYTYARLRRLALYTVLNVRASDMLRDFQATPPLHILGFTAKGQAYLHQRRRLQTHQPITKVTAKLGAAKGPLGFQVRLDRAYAQLNGQEQNFKRQVLRYD